MRTSRLRRARCLVSYWDGADLVLENYLTGRQTCVDPLALHLLHRAGDWVETDHLTAMAGMLGGGDPAKSVRQLVECDLLLRPGSEVEAKDMAVDTGWLWSRDARFFHYASQNVRYEVTPEGLEELLGQITAERAAPSPVKRYDGVPRRKLSQPENEAGEFWDVLRRRRTHRRFRPEPIGEGELATVLRWTWGITHRGRHDHLGDYVLKTSPSGGSRHPIEVYPVVLRVDGVEPGVYHYATGDDSLELLSAGDHRDGVLRMCAEHHWFGDAAVVFFMTAVLERSMYKYRHSHAYRVIMMDAGHLGQTFHLVCTRLGLAPFTSAATNDRAIEEVLGIDGVHEVPVYAAATGLPA
ncbi:MAG TPA: SagB/ThcOx family dehydrogenase [Candidatus Limnocylindrales bacterium]